VVGRRIRSPGARRDEEAAPLIARGAAGWEDGDFATTVRLLLEAGEPVDPARVPTGRDDVDAVLRAHLAKRG
jgi:hypothetical protein